MSATHALQRRLFKACSDCQGVNECTDQAQKCRPNVIPGTNLNWSGIGPRLAAGYGTTLPQPEPAGKLARSQILPTRLGIRPSLFFCASTQYDTNAVQADEPEQGRR